MVRKGGGMTKAEREYLSRVAALGCIICGAPASIHHVRRYGETRKHAQTVPLCPSCHQGPQGIHTVGKKRFAAEVMSEDEMLRRTNDGLKEEADIS